MSDALQTVANVFQVIGVLVALGFSVHAINSGKREAAKERRTDHELQVLRSIIDIFFSREDEPEKLGRLRHYLLIIPGSDDMPMMRAALNARPDPKALRAFANLYPNAPALPANDRDRTIAQLRLEAVGADGWEREIHKAIKDRVDG